MRWGWPVGAETEWHRCSEKCHLAPGTIGSGPEEAARGVPGLSGRFGFGPGGMRICLAGVIEDGKGHRVWSSEGRVESAGAGAS
jgi:hypothetical protein